MGDISSWRRGPLPPPQTYLLPSRGWRDPAGPLCTPRVGPWTRAWASGKDLPRCTGRKASTEDTPVKPSYGMPLPARHCTGRTCPRHRWGFPGTRRKAFPEKSVCLLENLWQRGSLQPHLVRTLAPFSGPPVLVRSSLRTDMLSEPANLSGARLSGLVPVFTGCMWRSQSSACKSFLKLVSLRNENQAPVPSPCL